MPSLHTYPGQIAEYARQRWHKLRRGEMASCSLRESALLESEAFERLLSTAYQASMLEEESRSVTFRLLVSQPSCIAESDGPPTGLHRLMFAEPRPFTEHELRRLSPAAKYHRSLIGVERRDDDFVIWGILQSGPRWLQAARGGRAPPSPVPTDSLIVRVTGPGRLAVSWGDITLAQVRAGRTVEGSMDVFESAWLPSRFTAVRGELMSAHQDYVSAGETADADVGSALSSRKMRLELDAELPRMLGQQMVKRLVAVMRAAHHGGTVVLLSPNDAVRALGPSSPLRIKYRFAEDEGRRRYRALILATMRVLSESDPPDPAARVADWSVYQRSSLPALAALDDAIFEMSHLIAALADVDGFVLMTQRFELLGFGAEIAGTLPEIDRVRRAQNLEATEYELEAIDGVGTRHRSAYRLCEHWREATALVVSQDGGARFIAWHNGATTYWDHVSADGADV